MKYAWHVVTGHCAVILWNCQFIFCLSANLYVILASTIFKGDTIPLVYLRYNEYKHSWWSLFNEVTWNGNKTEIQSMAGCNKWEFISHRRQLRKIHTICHWPIEFVKREYSFVLSTIEYYLVYQGDVLFRNLATLECPISLKFVKR